MLTILLSYLNMKENIRFLTPQVKHFTNQNKSFSSPSSQDGSIEYLHEDLQRKIITILLFDIFLVSSLHHADYPQSLDYQSLQFYLGVFYMVMYLLILKHFQNFLSEFGKLYVWFRSYIKQENVPQKNQIKSYCCCCQYYKAYTLLCRQRLSCY